MVVFRKKKKQERTLWAYREEAVGVLIAASFLFLFLSLVSYNEHDNSWFYFSSVSKPIFNWCGIVGAHFSALLVFLFGSAAYFFVGCLLIFSIFLLRAISIKEEYGRLIGLGGVVLTSATIFRAHEIGSAVLYPGGVVGEWIYYISLMMFQHIGTVVFMYALCWISILIAARISLLHFLSYVGKAINIGARFVATWSYKIAKATSLFVAYCVTWLWSKYKRKKAGDNVWRGLSAVEQKNRSKKPSLRQAQGDRELRANGPINKHNESAKKEEEQTNMIEAHDFLYEKKLSCGENFLFVRNTALPEKTFKKDVTKNNESLFDEIKSRILRLTREPVISYKLPDFKEFEDQRAKDSDRESLEALCKERAKKLEEKLLHFGMKGKVTNILPGPVITLFEYEPEINMKVSKILALEDDLALALRAISIRIIAPIPGRNVVGFEISNRVRHDVFLSDILAADEGEHLKKQLPIVLGVDITGNSVIEDLVAMPHLLVAGSTGSGKSVGLNTMLVSLLCRLVPEELRVILIDPKRLEFASYTNVPHLLFPIVTSPRKAIPVLKWVVQEMEDRYETMASVGVKNVTEYHKLYACQKEKDGIELKNMPFIVVIIDEFADLMMVAGKEVEEHLARIAQMARAAGIHMIVATQRPSVDVLTGVIKVNFPSRIAFRVSSKIDSRTILDASGSEKLLGRGDMLFMNSISSDLQRVHGAFVSDQEIKKLTEYLCSQQKPEYLDLHEALRKESNVGMEIEDSLYDKVVEFIRTIDDVSISMLQRHYRIGFNRSARLIEKLEMDGLIAPAQGSKPRKVLR
jgi:DNA segregation ATPase FtsK/SpoIIIE, S-DNA-T family